MSGFNQEISLREVQIYQEYQIALTTGTTSTAQLLAFTPSSETQIPRQTQILVLEARGDNVIFNFGTSSVIASKTLTNNALPAGNFSIAQGAIFSCVINGNYTPYVSCIAEGTGSASTYGIIRLAKFAL